MGSFVALCRVVLLVYQVKSGITDFKDKERVVSVKGLAEMEVAADKGSGL